jgi:hypothetical protein
MILTQNKYLGSIVAQGMFQLREISQIEKEMCHFCRGGLLLLNGMHSHSYPSVLLVFTFVCLFVRRTF